MPSMRELIDLLTPMVRDLMGHIAPARQPIEAQLEHNLLTGNIELVTRTIVIGRAELAAGTWKAVVKPRVAVALGLALPPPDLPREP